jgi:small subunit ribosomal protein S18
LDDESRSEAVMDRLGRRWIDANGSSRDDRDDGGEGTKIDDGFGTLNDEHARVATRIREERMAVGIIGRDPAYATPRGEVGGREDGGGTLPLSSREYRALKAHAKKEHGIDRDAFANAVDDDDFDLIPHNLLSSGSDDVSVNDASSSASSFDADLDLAYLNTRMHRRAFGRTGGGEVDDPFADLLPSDLNPARKVNRRNAHPIPRRLVHHNNLSLLRRYTTPGGKIMNRVQSRLGAKDQRKVATIVKRARHLGLIPHIGQWKFEDHGTVARGNTGGGGKEDMDGSTSGVKDWEVELEKRGLWPLQDSTELVKRFYDMDKILEHVAGPRGGNKRAEFDRLLGGPGALVG